MQLMDNLMDTCALGFNKTVLSLSFTVQMQDSLVFVNIAFSFA